jgi:hypothetical protein
LGTVLVMQISSEVKDVAKIMPKTIDTTKLSVNVFPQSSIKGTQFLVIANYFAQREQQDLELNIGKSSLSESAFETGTLSTLKLYDDGNHQDGKAGDGVYGGFFDTQDSSTGEYEIKSEQKILSLFKVIQPSCENIFNGNFENKINFVILGADYSDLEDLKKDAEGLILGNEGLLSIEPFKSNKDKFSFVIANSSRDLECKLNCNNASTVICCNNNIVREEASQCHYDNIIVFFNNKNSGDVCGSSSSYAKICSKSNLAGFILSHELGHSFADLADEYVYDEMFGAYSIGEINNANCDVAGCDKWKNITDGCFKGCTYSNLYRPVKRDSIMLDISDKYNIVCINHMQELIKSYSLVEKNIEKAAPKKKSYYVNLNYDRGDIKIKNIYINPVKAPIELKNSDYSVKISDEKGKIVYESSLYIPRIDYPLPNSSASMVVSENLDFSIELPFFATADLLTIYKKDKPVAENSLSIFADKCGNQICDKNENHMSCAQDCAINDNVCETNECDPDCLTQNCKIAGKAKIYLGIFLIISSLIILIIFVLIILKNRNNK